MKLEKNEFRKYAIKHHRINSIYVDKFMTRVNNILPTALTPYIIEERQLNVAQMDVFSRLMVDGIIFLGDTICEHVANIIQAQLLFMDSLSDKKKDISIYINSPGGAVYAGLGIYDTMQLISSDVATTCTGVAASMAAVLLCAGTKGKRAALPHSRIMIHQPMGGVQGPASDIEITAKEIGKLKKELYQIIADHTGIPYSKVWKTSDRDHWMIAEEAKEFGMVDEVLLKKSGHMSAFNASKDDREKKDFAKDDSVKDNAPADERIKKDIAKDDTKKKDVTKDETDLSSSDNDNVKRRKKPK